MTTEPLTDYEERLLGELTAVVSARAGEAGPTPLAARRRRWVPLTAAAGTVAAGAAALTTLTLLPGGAPVSSAYAVEKLPNGVGVTIHDANRLEGLDQSLADIGVPATVVPIKFGCPDPPSNQISLVGYTIQMDLTPGSNDLRLYIYGPPLPAGEKLYFGFVTRHEGPDGQLGVRFEGEISSRARTCFPAVPGDEKYPRPH